MYFRQEKSGKPGRPSKLSFEQIADALSQDKSPQEIARDAGVTPVSVWHRIERNPSLRREFDNYRARMRERDISQTRNDRATGEHRKIIAARRGYSIDTITVKERQAGLPPRASGPSKKK